MDPLLNYFNYFTEIERFYQTKRESFTLLSTLDWVLIESWKEQGVPLEAVLKGIDRAFSRTNARRKINSLAYCAKAIAEVCDEEKDLQVEKPALPEVSPDEFASYMDNLARSVTGLNTTFPEFAARFDAIASAIRGLNTSSLRETEQTLTALEEKLIALLKVACDEAVLIKVKQSVDADLSPFRSSMTTEQLAMLEQQMWRRKLMDHFEVPRLSLFYLV